ncbi:MAG TPA: hypothetical protein VK524_31305 [Polyangiaceae bacterium]|nr:hypothetical protein [Polyangiaceae bacterium]
MTEPFVLAEPAEITQVVDAFDGDDQFDLHLSLGYQHTWKRAQIRRESSIVQPGLSFGGYTEDTLQIASYQETTSRLNTRAEIGLFRDVALIVRVPIILANDRKLEGASGSESQQSTRLVGLPGEQLFRLPFTSPTRSGVEYLAVGADVAIMNQFRDSTKPSWVVGLEGRFSVSEPMHACNKKPSALNVVSEQIECAEPSDINRNGVSGEFQDAEGNDLEGSFSGGRSAGVSRGTTALELHTYLSKRIKYVEPYAGFRALFEFQNGSSDYGSTDFEGSIVNHPPLQGTLLVGTNIIPWEVRDSHQRIAIDVRASGTYVSEGRDYSELFDALGSSDAPSLRTPLYAEYQANPDPEPNVPSVVKTSSERVYFTGLTDVQQHGVYNFSTSFTWQAGRYVKFNVGGAYTLVQGHLISFDQPCNADFDDDVGKSGPCREQSSPGEFEATGIPNPNYRAVINAPGRRFKVDDAHLFDVWLNATVMF